MFLAVRDLSNLEDAEVVIELEWGGGKTSAKKSSSDSTSHKKQRD